MKPLKEILPMVEAWDGENHPGGRFVDIGGLKAWAGALMDEITRADTDNEAVAVVWYQLLQLIEHTSGGEK